MTETWLGCGEGENAVNLGMWKYISSKRRGTWMIKPLAVEPLKNHAASERNTYLFKRTRQLTGHERLMCLGGPRSQ